MTVVGDAGLADGSGGFEFDDGGKSCGWHALWLDGGGAVAVRFVNTAGAIRKCFVCKVISGGEGYRF